MPDFRLLASTHFTRRASVLVGCLALGTLMAGTALAQPAEPPLLKFGEFYRQPIGPTGLVPTERLQALDGRTVRLRGWMVQRETPAPGYFLFTPVPVHMSEHADGDADDLPPATVLVWLPAGQAATPLPHQPGLIELSGVLHVGRVQAADGRVSWVQLQLAPQSPPSSP